jgi:preprotein translocase subunit SecA
MELTKEQIDDTIGREALEQLMIDDALEIYAKKEETIGAEALRDIERRVLLSVLDQKWREHLYEMDYLQEGINLRAMGQQDPLAEWQREGFDMFEAMMGQIDDDFVRYVFHLQVVVEDEQPTDNLRNVSYSAPSDQPVQGEGAIAAAMAAQPELPPEAPEWAGGDVVPMADEAPQVPVKVDKTPGRNEPCFCGSGKKYKLCHGK